MRNYFNAIYFLLNTILYFTMLLKLRANEGLESVGYFSMIYAYSTNLRLLDITGNKIFLRFLNIKKINSTTIISKSGMSVIVFATSSNLILSVLAILLIHFTIIIGTDFNPDIELFKLYPSIFMLVFGGAAMQFAATLCDKLNLTQIRLLCSYIVSFVLFIFVIYTPLNLSDLTLVLGLNIFVPSVIIWYLLSRRVNTYRIFRMRNVRNIKNIFTYSTHIWKINLLVGGFDPFLRFILLNTSGPILVAQFEFLSRPFSFARRLIMSLIQPDLPVWASKIKTLRQISDIPAAMRETLYNKIYVVNFCLSVCLVPYFQYLEVIQEKLITVISLSIFLLVCFHCNVIVFLRYYYCQLRSQFWNLYIAHTAPLLIILVCFFNVPKFDLILVILILGGSWVLSSIPFMRIMRS